MNKKIIEIVKKVWKEVVENDDPSRYKKYIKKLPTDLLLKSAEEYGTPQYILDKNQLQKRARLFLDTFKKHIPNIEAYYAFKCNDFPVLIKTLKQEGFYADVAGIFELQLALKLGFEKIVFTSPGKSYEEIDLAAKNGVIINIDNDEELEELIKLKKPGLVSIRINPSNSVTKVWSKFGYSLDQLKDVWQVIKRNNYLKLMGLHFHCSWNLNPSRYVENIRLIGTYLKNNISKEDLESLEFFNIGGGYFAEDIAIVNKFGLKADLINMVKEYEKFECDDFDPHKFKIEVVEPIEKFALEISAALKENIQNLIPNIKIFCEPGRYIATHSTSILLKVKSVKEDCVIVNGGINMVGDFRFEEYAFAPIVNLSNFSHQLNKKTIYGPLCDPSDLWGYSYYGADIKKGDILAVLHQGAYTLTCAWRFIKPIPPYIFIEGNEIILGKSSEKFEDRYANFKFID
ncbi:MAG: hypothetical protein ABIC04_04355 [Nanoarchaeota archaeon]